MPTTTRVWQGSQQLRRMLVPVGELRRHPSNPRRGNVDAIRASLRRFGQQRPVLALPDGTIVAGNHTWQALVDEGWTHCAAVRTELSETEAGAYLAADNRTSDLGDYDNALLTDLLRPYYEQDDLAGIGYERDEFEELIAQLSYDNLLQTRRDAREQERAEQIPPEPQVPTSVPGVVYELGPHRLVCGDSTSPDAWDLIGDADVMFTSPPYALGGTMRLRGPDEDRRTPYDMFDDSPEVWPGLMAGFMDHAEARTKVQIVNVQMLAQNKRALIAWLADRADRLAEIAVWDKETAPPAMAEGVLSSGFEFLIVFAGQDATRRMPFSTFHGTESNVVKTPPQRHNPHPELHAATMPLALADHVIGKWVGRATSVIDPFAGLGTTMMSCDALGKSCLMIELSPVYCDVIRQRYADYAERPDLAP